MPDIEFAHTVLLVGCEPLDDAPILDLRIRKGVRRRGVQLAIASARPSALEPNARVIARYAPGETEPRSSPSLADELAGEARSELAQLLHRGRRGRRHPLGRADRRRAPRPSCCGSPRRSASPAATAPGCWRSPPSPTAAACARPAACRPPARATPTRRRRAAARPAIAAAVAEGELTALHLFELDPLRDLPDRAAWERALHGAGLVVAHASVLTAGLAEHANVIFPAESHAEKEGTLVHPDGRLQRLRTAIAHPGEVRSGWSVIADIAKACGLDLGVLTSSMAFAQLRDAVPFYAGLTLEEIGGRGVRWPARAQASAMPGAAASIRWRCGPRPPPARPKIKMVICASGTYRLDLGLPRGRDLPRAALRDRRAARRARARGRAAAGHRPRRRGDRGAERHADPRRARTCGPVSRPAPRSSPTGWPTSPPTRSPNR